MENHTHSHPQVRCMRVAEVAKKLGIGKSTVWKFAAEDVSFPRQFSLSPKVTVWYEHEIDAFIASKRPTVH
jgi:prophage regulatory protein